MTTSRTPNETTASSAMVDARWTAAWTAYEAAWEAFIDAVQAPTAPTRAHPNHKPRTSLTPLSSPPSPMSWPRRRRTARLG
jgi:hypothetical protein